MTRSKALAERLDSDALARGIAEGLSAARLPLSTEMAMQDAIEMWLVSNGYAFVREVRLSPADRIDFMVETDAFPGAGIEVKLKSPKRALADQVARYAIHKRIGALVVVSNVTLPLPKTVAGKPVYFVSPGRAYL